MDYFRQPLTFRVRKAVRYVQLYGPRRTAVKVRGQYHMRKSGSVGTFRPQSTLDDAHVGILGCGNFAYTTIGHYLARNVGAVIRGTMDVEGARARSLGERYGAHYATDDASRIIEDPSIDLVYIASNHASHAEYAIDALRAGKHVHIEKPHVVTEDQLDRLCAAMVESPGRVALGFNRPNSVLGRRVKALSDTQDGPSMFNWFIAGHEIARDHWYYDPAEGGRVLGNLCHWTDFVLQMVEPARRFPIRIGPTSAIESDTDIAVAYVFGDATVAAITFSAKGHAFEGVKEQFAMHRGDILLSLVDFQRLRADVGIHRVRQRLPFRDHGHEATIMRSYLLSAATSEQTEGCSVDYVRQTGQLFLATRRALEEDRVITLEDSNAVALDEAASN